MKLQDALGKVYAPQGVTTIISAVLSGDGDPIRTTQVSDSLAEAEVRLVSAKAAQDGAQSDWAYWGYAGEVAKWNCIVDILRAAQISGPDSLPDVPFPDMEGSVVMDAQGKMEDWGREILRQAGQRVNGRFGRAAMTKPSTAQSVCPRCGGSGSLPDMSCCSICGGGGTVPSPKIKTATEGHSVPSQSAGAQPGEVPRLEPGFDHKFVDKWEAKNGNAGMKPYTFARHYAKHVNATLTQRVKDLKAACGLREWQNTACYREIAALHQRAETAEAKLATLTRQIAEAQEVLQKHDICPKCFGRFSGPHCFSK